jgi:hypothetical protein
VPGAARLTGAGAGYLEHAGTGQLSPKVTLEDSWRPATAAAAVYVYWVSEAGKHDRFGCVYS